MKEIHYCKQGETLCSLEFGSSEECTPLPHTGVCKRSMKTLLYIYNQLEKKFEESSARLREIEKVKDGTENR